MSIVKKKPATARVRSPGAGAIAKPIAAIAVPAAASVPKSRQAVALPVPSTDEAKEAPRRVNLSVDPSRRPLAGADIVRYSEQHRLERVQIVEAMAIASPGAFTKLVRNKDVELPFQVELLLRFYMKQPSKQRKLLPIEVFNDVYGDVLESFSGAHTAVIETARMMLYERFAAMLGRTIYSAFRWFKRGQGTNNYGVANGPLRRLFAQLPDDPVLMRRELESLARTAWRVRGEDFDAKWPIPDPNKPPEPRRPGPPRKTVAAQ